MKAICTIRRDPHYRHEAFLAGLGRAGYRVVSAGRPDDKRDLLVVWNLHGGNERAARDWEAAGGTVVVCENGYMGKDADGRQFYAMSLHGHNGAGWFPVGGQERFDALGIELLPWASNPAGHLLLACQRGIGSRQMASPARWDTTTVRELNELGFKNLVVRQHPGRIPPTQTLLEQLAGARACVIWSSASGITALTHGIPVVYTAPHWIAAECAARGLAGVNHLVMDDAARLRALTKAAWGQRSVAEIESGEPFVTFRERLGEATC